MLHGHWKKRKHVASRSEVAVRAACASIAASQMVVQIQEGRPIGHDISCSASVASHGSTAFEAADMAEIFRVRRALRAELKRSDWAIRSRWMHAMGYKYKYGKWSDSWKLACHCDKVSCSWCMNEAKLLAHWKSVPINELSLLVSQLS